MRFLFPQIFFLSWSTAPDVTIYLLAGPHYLNLLKHLMAIQSSSGFSHLQPRVFHIALQTHKTQHTQPRGWKKRRTNKHGLGSAPSTRREKFVTLLCGFCGLLWACIRAKFLHSYQERRLVLMSDPTSESTGPNSSLSSCLSLTITFSRLLLTAFFCSLPWDLAFSCLLLVS